MTQPANHPTTSHASSVDALLEKMTNVSLAGVPVKQGGEPLVPKETPVAEVVVEVTPAAVVEDNSGGAASDNAVVEITKPAQGPPKNKLAKSMEIQRRAEEATRRARAEASKLRRDVKPKETKAEVDPAIEQLKKEKFEISAIRQNLEAEIKLAKDSPLEFARRHGVTGQDVAEFVRQGADPTERKIARIQADADAKIRALEEKTNQRLSALQDTIINSQELDAQRNFFTFIEESKAANPDAFAAVASGLVFSDKEVWDTANRLLETRKDLQNDFDEDRLLEAVEVEARKDPRWSRVQALTKAQGQTQTTKSNDTVANKKSNVKQKEEVAEVTPRERPARDSATGQFAPAQGTPFTRHQSHLDQVLRTVRLP